MPVTRRLSPPEGTPTALDLRVVAGDVALPIGIGLVTPDLRYVRVDEALARMNGRSIDELLGHTIHEVMGEHAAATATAAHEVIRRRAPVDLEMTLRTAASPDRERYLEATYFPVLGPEDDPRGSALLGVGTVVRDITARREREQEHELLLRGALAAAAEAEAARRRAEAALVEAEARRVAAEADRQRLAFLAQATKTMAGSLDYEATLQAVASSTVPDVADWAMVTVVEPGVGLQVRGVAHRDPDRLGLVSRLASGYIPGPDSTITQAIRTGEPVIITDISDAGLTAMGSSPVHRDLLAELGVRHLGSWPISSPNGTVLGALSLVLEPSGRRFSAEDRDVAEALAGRAGLHVANARLHRERTQIARTLQMSLRPRELPTIAGIDLGSAFTAAGSDTIVGGDFFDVFQGADGTWTALLGDVVGKGVTAAVITAAARHTLRTGALVEPEAPRNLALLNQVLLSEPTDPIEFCTVVYARLSPRRDGLGVRISHAGHPAALVVTPGGEVTAVEGGRGPAVGIYADAAFSETDIHLEPGALLVLYTDGVTEARADDLPSGRRALITTLRATHGRSAAEVAEAIQNAALALTDGHPRDDIAVLVVKASVGGS